jgi:hypothetical protein
MLDLDQPQTPHVFAASRQLDLILDYLKRITYADSPGRLWMLEIIRPCFAALRWLQAQRFAADSMAARLMAGVPVLVCCSAGMSRSVCLAAAGVARAEGLPLAEALAAVVGAGPADVSPGLFGQFREALGG